VASQHSHNEHYRADMPELRPFVISILAALLIIACQSNSVQRAPNLPSLVDCRIIQHAFGKACVPTVPKRLVSLDDTTLADALALKVPSVGASLIEGQLPDYLASSSSKMTLLGKSGQPNLEKILRIKPDLIIGIELFGEPIFKELSQIAPTALGNWNGFPTWREYFDFIASTLNKKDKAKQTWDSYEQKIDEIKAALGNQLQEFEVSVVYACCGTITIDTENSFAGSILADIGIRRPKGHSVVEDGTIILSEERISEIDADILFVSVYDAESEKILADWRQKPLWNHLKAVQKGQVYVVNYDIWRGGNPIAANLLISDLFKYLVER
jgi:iron complex transport system substrate-binding protein